MDKEKEQDRLALTRSFPAMLLVLADGLYVGVDAQTSTVSSISVTVRDPTGAVIAKAEVLIPEEGRVSRAQS